MKHRYICVISRDVPKKIKERLAEKFDIIELPPDDTIASPASCHPDMLISIIGKRIIVPAEYYLKAKEEIDAIASYGNLKIIKSNFPRSVEYPEDISVNSLICDDNIFCLKKHTAPEILRAAEDYGYKAENVRQGYAACSAVSFGRSVVTADTSIKKAAESQGLSVLHIVPGHIVLDGYTEGFIGGASGVCEDRVFFFGSLDFHPDGEKIKKFLQENNKEYISLYDGELLDFGGIKFVKKVLA